MLYEAILLAIILGVLTKGSIMNLAKLNLVSVPYIFSAFILKYGLDFFAYKGATFSALTLWSAQGAAYILLFIFLYKNRHTPGMKMMFVGMFLNFIVIMANSGTMPVNIVGLDADTANLVLQNKLATHSLISAQTKYPLLADIWLQTFPALKKFSIGDVLISIGVFYLVWATMRTKDKKSYRLNSFISREEKV